MANLVLSGPILTSVVKTVISDNYAFYDNVNKTYSGDIQKAGTSVLVQTMGLFSFTEETVTRTQTPYLNNDGTNPLGDVAANYSYTATDVQLTGNWLLINKRLPLKVLVAEEDIVQSPVDGLEGLIGERIGRSIGRTIEKSIVTAIYTDNVSLIPSAQQTSIAVTASNALETLEALRVSLQQNYVEDVVAIVSPTVESMLMSQIRQNLANNDKHVNFITRLGSMDVYGSPALTGSQIVVFHRNAIALALQIRDIESVRSPNFLGYHILGLALYGRRIIMDGPVCGVALNKTP